MIQPHRCPQCNAENMATSLFCGHCKMFIGDIGPYRLLFLLAEGGHGAIYRGENRRTGYQVAIKLLHGHLDNDQNIQKRFQREASILQGIRHPHIVNVFDAGVFPGLGSYLVMEWLEGETLATYVQSQAAKKLSLSQALPLFSQLLEGLTCIHDAGIVHRDLKPANLMLLHQQGQPRLKLLDFGVAQLRSGEPLTETGKTIGTPEFMAPEQFDSDFGMPGPQTDLYAVGQILYWALTGQMAFSGETLQELLMQKLHGTPEVLARLDGHTLPLALVGVVERALQPQAVDRYPDAMSMLNALRRAIPAPLQAHTATTQRRQYGTPETRTLDAVSSPQSEPHIPPTPAPTPTSRSRITEAMSLSLQPPGAGYHPHWYIPRPKEEALALTHLASPGAPVVLWGPELLGKTWMLKYIATVLKSQSHRVVELSLKQLDEGSLASLDSLTRELALHISDELDAPTEWFEQAWKRPGNPLRKFTWFMGRKILPADDKPLVLVLDRIDEVQKQTFSDDFFGMLRSWAEDAYRDAWSQLRLLMAVSTTPTLLTERPNQSPFNLTPPVYLDDFGLEQLRQLAARYQLPWDDDALQSVLSAVGGHPYLVRLIMYHATARLESLEALLDPQHVLYQPYLNRYRSRLRQQPSWRNAIQMLHDTPTSKLKPEIYHQLYKVGLVTSTPDGEHMLRYSFYKRLLV